MGLQQVVDDLLAATGASRVTLRQAVDGDVFPIIHEALAPGTGSLKGVATPNMSSQPVVLEVTQGRQVVQEDCRNAFPDDAPFHEMLELYGGMQAQIVTPVVAESGVVAIVSLHQLGRPRSWTDADVNLCRRAADRVRSQLEGHR